MKFKTYLFLSLGIFLSQSTMAESFTETFHGVPKLNLNLYAFGADVDGKIGQGNLSYKVDQPFKETIKELDHSFMAHVDLSKGRWGLFLDHQTVETSQEKSAMSVPVALSTKLDQASYGLYYQAYISPETTTQNYPKLVIEPTIGINHTKAEANLSALNQTLNMETSWNEFFWAFGVENTISVHAYLGYRIPIMNRNLNIRAGYRYFDQDYKANNFHWDIRQQGPVIGINLPIF